MPRIFEGLKIADFSWVGVGPISMRYFADYGATVVRIESATHPEHLRLAPPYKDGIAGVDRTAFYANYNAGKYSAALNLKHPEAREVAKRYFAWADIVAESFTAGTVDELGLGYEAARAVNPRIIYFSSTNQGQTGPYRSHPGFGTQLVSLAGFTTLSGWPDRDPAGTYGAYTDFISPRFAASIVAAALLRRDATGEGMRIDLAQLEAGLQFLAPLLLDYTVNGRVATRKGNRSSRAAPHGAYPCLERDRWCAITVFTDAHWRGLLEAMGSPAWAGDPKFATLLWRKRHEVELDEHLGEWTRGFAMHDLAEMLQGHGVPAYAVQNGQDLYADPQLEARGHFQEREHAVIGAHHYDSYGFRLSETAGSAAGPAPCLGQHSEKVYGEFLGYTEEELGNLIANGVVE